MLALEYKDDVVLLTEDPSELWVFHGHLKDDLNMFDVYFAPSKYIMLLQDWICWNANLYGQEQMH